MKSLWEQNKSIGLCRYCGKEAIIKDIRDREKLLCPTHEHYRMGLERNNWFRNSTKTDAEKIAALRADKTVRVGSFFNMKRD